MGILLCAPPAAAEGEDLIGVPAPEFDVAQWLHSEPLTLAQLYGTVVLVRFWTDGCPLCGESAPVLAQLHESYADDGLVIIGIYHPKPAGEVDLAVVERSASAFGMDFPIGVDPEWQTLERWWLRGAERSWTSPSLLIDRKGIVRFLHEGGAYTPEDAEALENAIVNLLARMG